MRPARLELEGFSAYRERGAVDFTGADLFVIVGPTGSGKSSLIDAMTFALYGAVSRYDNPNLVAPVITQGKNEARVRFDFTVREKPYTAVRVVRRTAKGATTKEARLESEGDVLAGTADELTREVEKLLGLNFEQFTTCVVLPQGDFDRFLKEKPAQRQDLLTRLLALEIYARMGNQARLREAQESQKVKLLEQESAQLKKASPADRDAARARCAALDRLRSEVESAQPELERLREESQRKEEETSRLEQQARLLEALHIPEGTAELDRRLRRAREELEEAGDLYQRSQREHEEARAARAKLPDRLSVEKTRQVHADRNRKTKALDEGRAARAAAEAILARVKKTADGARGALEAARKELSRAEHAHAAFHLAEHLSKGKPCPVCRRVVERVPRIERPVALTEARERVEAAEKQQFDAEEKLKQAERGAAAAQQRVATLEDELAALEEMLSGAPSLPEIEARIATIEAAERELETRQAQLDAARKEELRRRNRYEACLEEERRAWALFDRARDELAPCGPPPPADRTDLAASWESLLRWSREQAPRRREEAERTRAIAARAIESRSVLLNGWKNRCAELGVSVREDRVRDALVSALAEVKAEIDRIAEAMARAEQLDAQIRAAREKAQVAGALGRHLAAGGFERWLLDEAFQRLVSGGSEILRELSHGQYSFHYDKRLQFEVIDHFNADERRSARTLSGGETFLASLALALALSDQLVEITAGNTCRLESVFLDEGFGTLDEEMLQTVGDALEELGSRGRTVGLITHREALARRIPVQFAVSKGSATASVERVTQ